METIKSLEETAAADQFPWERPVLIRNLRLKAKGCGDFLYEAEVGNELDVHAETLGFVEIGVCRLQVVALAKVGSVVTLYSHWSLGANRKGMHLRLEPWRIAGSLAAKLSAGQEQLGGLTLLEKSAAEVPAGTESSGGQLIDGILSQAAALLIEPAGTDATPVLTAITAARRAVGQSVLVACQSLAGAERFARNLFTTIGSERVDASQDVLLMLPWSHDEIAGQLLVGNFLGKDPEFAQLVRSCQHGIDSQLAFADPNSDTATSNWARTSVELSFAERRREDVLQKQVDRSRIAITTLQGVISSTALSRKSYDTVIIAGAGEISAPFVLFALSLGTQHLVVSGDPFAGPPLTRVKSWRAREVLGQNVFHHPVLSELWDRHDPAGNVFFATSASRLARSARGTVSSALYRGRMSVTDGPVEASEKLSAGEPEPGQAFVVIDTSNWKLRASVDATRSRFCVLSALFAACLAAKYSRNQPGIPVRLLSPYRAQRNLHLYFLDILRAGQTITSSTLAASQEFADAVVVIDLVDDAPFLTPGTALFGGSKGDPRQFIRRLLTRSTGKTIFLGNAEFFGRYRGPAGWLYDQLRDMAPFQQLDLASLVGANPLGLTVYPDGGLQALEGELDPDDGEVIINWPNSGPHPASALELMRSRPASLRVKLAGPLPVLEKVQLLNWPAVTSADSVAEDWLALTRRALWWLGGPDVLGRPAVRLTRGLIHLCSVLGLNKLQSH